MAVMIITISDGEWIITIIYNDRWMAGGVGNGCMASNMAG
jgi:hypothetical protein